MSNSENRGGNTNEVGRLIRREVRRRKGAALREWHPHGLSEAI